MSRARDIADTGDNNLDDIVVDGSGNLDVTGTVTADGITVDGGANALTRTSSGAEVDALELRNNATATNTATTLKFTNSTAAGSNSGSTELVGIRTGTNTGDFVIRTADSSSNMNERLRIDSSGKLLVGTSSVPTGTTDGVAIQPASAGQILSSRNSTGGVTHVDFKNPNGTVGFISTSGSSTTYSTSSDYRLKENVTADWDATTRLKQLNPVRFNFIADADTTVDGFLAHEVQSVVPEAITGTHNEVDDEGNPVYQGIDQSKLVPLLVKTIQELEARIAALENA